MPVDRPTFSESWYRIADMRPRLRPTVQIHRQHFRGQTWHVVQDPSNNQFFRLNEAAYRFVALLDGRRTVGESWKACNDQLGDSAPTQGEAIQLLGQLYVSNLLLSEVPPDAQSLFERYRKRVRREVQGYLMNLMFIRIPLFDPDHFLNRWVGLLGSVFSIPGLIFWLIMVGIGLYSIMGHFDQVLASASNLGRPGEGVLSADNLPLLYACFVFTKIFHEFGHAFACKKFGRQEGSGGEVHVMGIMFLIFTPFPYVDASSSWAFRSKWRRIVVGAAGVLVELVIASIAAVIWSRTAEGALIHKLAYNVMFISGISTVLFNGNPLLRYDGYYVLSDLLEIPNLAQRSKQYLYYLVRKYAWNVRQARNPAHTTGERVWMVIYGIASTIYRVVICVAILLFVADQLPVLGLVLASAAVIAWVLVPLGKFLHYLGSNTELMRVRGRAVGTTVLVLGAILAGIGTIKAPDRSVVEGIVEPEGLVIVNAKADGFVRQFLPTGQPALPTGKPLLVAENKDLKLKVDMAQAELKEALARRSQAQAKHDTNLVQQYDALVYQLNRYITWATGQLDDLRLYAPSAGTWDSPHVDKLEGAYVRRGDRVGLIGDFGHMVIRAVAPQDVPIDRLNDDVEIMAKNRPETRLDGKIERILPGSQQELPSPAMGLTVGGSIEIDPTDTKGIKAAEKFNEIRVTPDGSHPLYAGQRVLVRISRPDSPLAWQWYRSVRQLIQKRFQG